MPVEIREIVIQAKVPDKTTANHLDQQTMPVQRVNGDANDRTEVESQEISAEWIQKIVDICLKEVKVWLTEKSIR